MTTAVPREELETRYQRARQRIWNQRSELKALNKAIRFQQSMWRDAHKQTEHWRQMWWEATHAPGYRYGYEPKPVTVHKVAWLPTLIALLLGLSIGSLWR